MSERTKPQTAAIRCQIRAIVDYCTDPDNRGVILGVIAGELQRASDLVALEAVERAPVVSSNLAETHDAAAPRGLLDGLAQYVSTPDGAA